MLRVLEADKSRACEQGLYMRVPGLQECQLLPLFGHAKENGNYYDEEPSGK